MPLDQRVDRIPFSKLQNATALSQLPDAGRYPRGSIQLPAGQPVGVGVGGWPVPGEDRRSGIANDPNRTDVQRYVLRLTGKVINA